MSKESALPDVASLIAPIYIPSDFSFPLGFVYPEASNLENGSQILTNRREIERIFQNKLFLSSQTNTDDGHSEFEIDKIIDAHKEYLKNLPTQSQDKHFFIWSPFVLGRHGEETMMRYNLAHFLVKSANIKFQTLIRNAPLSGQSYFSHLNDTVYKCFKMNTPINEYPSRFWNTNTQKDSLKQIRLLYSFALFELDKTVSKLDTNVFDFHNSSLLGEANRLQHDLGPKLNHLKVYEKNPHFLIIGSSSLNNEAPFSEINTVNIQAIDHITKEKIEMMRNTVNIYLTSIIYYQSLFTLSDSGSNVSLQKRHVLCFNLLYLIQSKLNDPTTTINTLLLDTLPVVKNLQNLHASYYCWISKPIAEERNLVSINRHSVRALKSTFKKFSMKWNNPDGIDSIKNEADKESDDENEKEHKSGLFSSIASILKIGFTKTTNNVTPVDPYIMSNVLICSSLADYLTNENDFNWHHCPSSGEVTAFSKVTTLSLLKFPIHVNCLPSGTDITTLTGQILDSSPNVADHTMTRINELKSKVEKTKPRMTENDKLWWAHFEKQLAQKNASPYIIRFLESFYLSFI